MLLAVCGAFGRPVEFELGGVKDLVKVPRKLSLVRFDFDAIPAEYHKYPFAKNTAYVFFGEIPNMPGHCVVADHKTGQVHSGYHTESFVELSEDECENGS